MNIDPIQLPAFPDEPFEVHSEPDGFGGTFYFVVGAHIRHRRAGLGRPASGWQPGQTQHRVTLYSSKAQTGFEYPGLTKLARM